MFMIVLPNYANRHRGDHYHHPASDAASLYPLASYRLLSYLEDASRPVHDRHNGHHGKQKDKHFVFDIPVARYGTA